MDTNGFEEGKMSPSTCFLDETLRSTEGGQFGGGLHELVTCNTLLSKHILNYSLLETLADVFFNIAKATVRRTEQKLTVNHSPQ